MAGAPADGGATAENDMRSWLILGAAALFGAGLPDDAARAQPSVELHGVAARVQVIPEARRDVSVSLVRADARLPIRVRRLGDRIYLTGDVGHRVRGCGTDSGRRGVAIWGRGVIPYEQLPQLVIRTPPVVRLLAGEAVFGEIGRSTGVDFTNEGCGDWTIADVQGRLRLNQAGSGAARVGSAGPSDLSVIGAGGIAVGDVRGGLTAISSGSGDISVASVTGAMDARVGGSGGIVVGAGTVDALTVSIAGSGAVRFRGVARSLRASIAGSGDVSVARVTGPVSRQVFGSGQVRVGPEAPAPQIPR